MLTELPSALRRDRDRPAQGGRRDPVRQDEHGRVRDGLVDREQRLRADPQPLGRVADAGRLVGRLGRGRRGRSGSAGARHRHRRLDPPAGGRLRRRRPQADLRPGQPLRPDRLRQLARPDRPVRPRPRRRGAASEASSPGHDPHDSTSVDQPVPDYPATLDTPPESLRIGVVREFFGEGLDPEVDAADPGGDPGLREGRGDDQGGLAAALEVRRPGLLPRRPGRVLEQPRPLRRHDLRPPRRGLLAEVSRRGEICRRWSG